jgi:hypothetical protein
MRSRTCALVLVVAPLDVFGCCPALVHPPPFRSGRALRCPVREKEKVGCWVGKRGAETGFGGVLVFYRSRVQADDPTRHGARSGMARSWAYGNQFSANGLVTVLDAPRLV